jgi:hypothetical protein
MSWGAVAGAAVGVVGSAMSDSGGGGGQSQSTSKQPWMPATPWLMDNLAQGQRLQGQYQAQPFNAQQQQAYGNQANQGAYMRAAVPSLLRQMQGNQIGFDRSNPNARPAAFNWDGLLAASKEGQAAAGQQQQGLLDMLNSGGAVNSSLTPMAEPPKEEPGTFTQQTVNWSPQQQYLIDNGRSPWMLGGSPDSFVAGNQAFQGDGGYGQFRYGMDVPKAGTKAYRDMQEYFLNGGLDPYGKYGDRKFGGNWMSGSDFGMGAATDDGGAAAAVGSSANF